MTTHNLLLVRLCKLSIIHHLMHSPVCLSQYLYNCALILNQWKSSQNFLRACSQVPTRLLHPWDFPGKSTGMGCHFLLQGIFLTQGLNPGLPHCRQTLYPLCHQGSRFPGNNSQSDSSKIFHFFLSSTD